MALWPFMARAEEAEPKVDKELEDVLLRSALDSSVMTKDIAMGVPGFAACVNKICDTVAMIPFRLYKYEKGEEVVEVKDDPRVLLLNTDPKDTLDATQLKKAIVKDYLTDRGGYVYIDRVGNAVRSLRYVDPGRVEFNYNEDPIFKSFKILVNVGTYEPYQFLKVLRNTTNGREGKSVVSENVLLLSTAHNMLKFQNQLMKTGGNKKGFVKSQKKLTREMIDALRSAWRRLYSNNSENVVILNDGLEFQEASNTSVEMQINENVETTTSQICEVLGVPPAILTGKATEEDKLLYIQYCITPILTEIENALNRDLLLESEKGVFLWQADTSELTKTDIVKRYQAYEIASKNGFMQTDEIRFRENLPPLDLDFVKLGLQDVLYDPKTKHTFVPNTNMVGGLDMAIRPDQTQQKPGAPPGEANKNSEGGKE